MGSRNDAVVRALASYQCGLGWNPRLGIISGLSLFLVLTLLRGFCSGFSGFPLFIKSNTLSSKFQFASPSDVPLLIPIYFFVYLLPPQGFGPETKTRGGTLGSLACTCIYTKGISRKYWRTVLVVWKFSRFDETRCARWSRVMTSVKCN